MTFTAPSVSGYNASPPPDDGTEDSTNEISWDKHKTKLGDPIKTCLEALMTELDRWITSDAQTDLVVAADLLTKLKTVDGSGSGLDADLLDGVSSAGFCKTANNLSDVTAATAFGNIKQAASTAATGVVELGTQAEVVSASDTARVAALASLKYHPGIAKAWASVTGGGSATVDVSHGVTSVTRNGAGTFDVVLSVTMASTDYCVIASLEDSGFGTSDRILIKVSTSTSKTTTTFRLICGNSDSNNSTDPERFYFVVYGTLA